MKNKLKVFSVIILALVMVFAFAGCGKKTEAPAEEAPAEETAEEEAPAETEPAVELKYGYNGDDPVIAEVYSYAANALSVNYEEAEHHIPIVQIVNVDDSDESDIKVCGDFWVLNYNVEGDTLKCVSGGNYPGMMHVEKTDEGYKVKDMQVAEDGGNFESSAKEIFGDNYEAFSKINSDSDAREKIRAEIIAEYVRQNGLSVTKYQDEGWDPVDIPL